MAMVNSQTVGSVETRAEDCWRHTFCSSISLTRGEATQHVDNVPGTTEESALMTLLLK
jgi:hypothetical protein